MEDYWLESRLLAINSTLICTLPPRGMGRQSNQASEGWKKWKSFSSLGSFQPLGRSFLEIHTWSKSKEDPRRSRSQQHHTDIFVKLFRNSWIFRENLFQLSGVSTLESRISLWYQPHITPSEGSCFCLNNRACSARMWAVSWGSMRVSGASPSRPKSPDARASAVNSGHQKNV